MKMETVGHSVLFSCHRNNGNEMLQFIKIPTNYYIELNSVVTIHTQIIVNCYI